MNLRRNIVLVAGALSLTACPAFMSDDFDIVKPDDKPDASGGDGGTEAGGSSGGGEGAAAGDAGEGAGGSSGSIGDGGSSGSGAGGSGAEGVGGTGGVGATGGLAGNGGASANGGTSGSAGLGGSGGNAGVGGSAGGTAGVAGSGTGGTSGSAGGGAGGTGGLGGSAGTSSCHGYLELVLDNSKSMEEDTSGNTADDGESRWDFMKAGIEAALPDLPATLALGMLPFPNAEEGSDECYVRKQSATLELLTPAHMAACRSALDDATFSQNSVLFDPWAYALELVAAEDQSANLAIVLTSDNWPQFGQDCSKPASGSKADNQPLIDAIKSAYDNVGIKTYVIGVPGAEDVRADFSRMAEAGGTGPNGCSHTEDDYCHIDLSPLDDEEFRDGFEEALRDIATKTMTCDRPSRRSQSLTKRAKP